MFEVILFPAHVQQDVKDRFHYNKLCASDVNLEVLLYLSRDVYPVEPEQELSIHHLGIDEGRVEERHVEAPFIVPQSRRTSLQAGDPFVSQHVHFQNIVCEAAVGQVGPQSVHGHVSDTDFCGGQVALGRLYRHHLGKEDSVMWYAIHIASIHLIRIIFDHEYYI